MMEFYFQNNSVKNSLKCLKVKPSTHCLNVLFPIYHNNNWTIKQTKFPLFHRIILKIVGYQQLTMNPNQFCPSNEQNKIPSNICSMLKTWEAFVSTIIQFLLIQRFLVGMENSVKKE